MSKPQRFDYADMDSCANEDPGVAMSRADDEETLAQVTASTKPTIKTVARQFYEFRQARVKKQTKNPTPDKPTRGRF
jgi:hypothetical protein